MPHLTGHDIRAEIENLAQSLAEYGHWPEEREAPCASSATYPDASNRRGSAGSIPASWIGPGVG